MSFLNRLPADLYAADAFDAFAPEGFSLAAARAMAWLAQFAYEDEPAKVETILRRWGLRPVAFFDRAAATTLPLPRTRGFLANGQGAAVLAFQGTDPLLAAHWVTNFSIRLNAEGIHRGFGSALEAVWPQLMTALDRAGLDLPLVIGGHSLGGALAVLAAGRIRQERGITAAGVYTFGMPRIGSPAFAAAYDQVLGDVTYRLIHGEDLVPTVPPSNFKFRYVGRLLRCARHARFDAALPARSGCDDPAFVAGLRSRVKVATAQLLSGSLGPPTRPDLIGRATRLLSPGIADHLPDRYWRALESPRSRASEIAGAELNL